MTRKLFPYSRIFAALSLAVIASATPSWADTLVATGSDIKLVSSTGTVQTFISPAGKAVVYNSSNQKIYYSTAAGTIRRANRDGTNSIEIVPPVGDSITDIEIDYAHSRLIWTEPMNASIRSADFDGGNVSMLAFGMSEPTGLFVDATNGYLYYTVFDGISRANLDGSNQTLLFADEFQVLPYLTLFNGKVYWSNATTGTIKRANVDGSSLEVLASGAAASIAQGVAYNSRTGRIEYIGSPDGDTTLRSMRAGGSSNTALGAVSGYDIFANFFVTDPSLPTSPDSTRAYFGIYDSQSAKSRVFWTNSSAQQVPVLSNSDIGDIGALAFSATQQLLYWSDNANPTESVIKRSNADGSGIETVTTVSGKVNGLTVDDSRGLLYISNKTAATIKSLSLVNPGVQETIHALSPENILIDGSLNSYSSDLLVYAFRINGSSTNSRGELVAKDGGHEVSWFITSGGLIGGLVPFGSRIALGTPRWTLQLIPFGALPSFRSGFLGPLFSGNIPMGIFGAQHLDPARFDVPYVLYYGYDHKIRAIIPLDTAPPVLNFISLTSSEELQAVTEVPLAPVFPTATPTPAAGTITGKVTVGVEAQTTANQTLAVSTSVNAANITVYLTPDLKNGSSFAIDDKPLTQTTRTDSEGVYTFTNVPDGDYTLRFSRNDLTFAAGTLSASPGSEVPPLLAAQRDVTSTNCSTTDRSALILAADTKAKKVVTLALSAAKKAYAKSKSKTGLQNASSVLSALHKNLVTVSASLPSVEISCTTPTTCSSTSYKSVTANYKKALAKLKKQSSKLLNLALKGKSNLSAQVKKLGTLSDAADKAALKLPSTSFSCPAPSVPDDEESVTLG